MPEKFSPVSAVPKTPETDDRDRITEEYRILHQVARILEGPGDLPDMLKAAMQALTAFEDLRVENKAGIFLADERKKILRLFVTYGVFSREFLEKEREVPYGDCLCGRVANSNELLMSESCFADPRHERSFTDMQAHGHYIVPLKSGDRLVGVLFLYTNTHPAWYRHSQEVLLSIGGLIAGAIKRKQIEQELIAYRDHLESVIRERTLEVMQSTNMLKNEIEGHKRTQAQLRALSRRIQDVREEEKARISRQVHDELGQSLTAIKMDLLHLNKKLAGKEADKLKETADMVDATIKTVQQIAMELRPPVLDAFGLTEAITWQAGEYRNRYGLAIDTGGLREIPELPPAIKTALFRVFQESITNIVRHAAASEVRLGLAVEDGQARLTVADNGKGIAEEKINDNQSLGLIGMRERLSPFQGNIAFDSAAGRGTTITVTLPLKTP